MNKVWILNPSTDQFLKIASGDVPGQSSVNKFGRAVSGIQTTITDIWDRADATATQQIWVAPTAARVHAIVSTSDEDSDTGGAVAQGDGARTVQVYGLTSWDTKETSEVVVMDGTTAKNTTSSYVIIHRIKVLTKGPTNVNVGTITATAASDASVTAEVNIGAGQTQMAIYGIPSIQTAYMTLYYATMVGAAITPATANAVDLSILVNPEPDAELTNFLTKHTLGLSNTATSHLGHPFNPYFKIAGPAIIKIQGLALNADTDVSAGFDLILLDN